MSQELKPCPCCGGEAVFKRRNFGGGHGGSPDTRWIECEQCGLRSPGFYFDDECESVVKKWNTRHIPEGYALISKAQIMTWYDVLQEAIESPQYDHEVRAKSAIGQMIKAAQEPN